MREQSSVVRLRYKDAPKTAAIRPRAEVGNCSKQFSASIDPRRMSSDACDGGRCERDRLLRFLSVSLTGDRGFESRSLHQRVSCEPDFLLGVDDHSPRTRFRRHQGAGTGGRIRCSLARFAVSDFGHLSPDPRAETRPHQPTASQQEAWPPSAPAGAAAGWNSTRPCRYDPPPLAGANRWERSSCRKRPQL